MYRKTTVHTYPTELPELSFTLETLRGAERARFQALGPVSMDNLKTSFLSTGMEKKEGRGRYSVL